MIGTSLRTIIAIFIVGLLFGGVIEWFAKDRWIELLMYPAFDFYGLSVPVGLVLSPFAVGAVWILFFAGRHHD